jgi:hypothetical protein
MKTLTFAGVTVACVLGIVAMLFLHQRRALQALRAQRTGHVARAATATGNTMPLQPPGPPGPRHATTPAGVAASEPPAASPNGSRLMDNMIAALEEKRPALEQAGDAAASALWAERLGILLDLSPEESESARAFFQQLTVEARGVSIRPDLDEPSRQQAFTALERRLSEFLASQFGEEKATRFRTAERARQEATIEHAASRALDDVGLVIDLPPAQKDLLYASFAAKARERTATFRPGQLKPQFTYAFQEGPRVGEPLTLARPVLTPEQIALYEKNRASEARGQQREMQTALGVMRTVFEQALGRSPAPQSAK